MKAPFSLGISQLAMSDNIGGSPRMYLPNPFHNFVHAVDVLCWLTMEMEKVEVGILLSAA